MQGANELARSAKFVFGLSNLLSVFVFLVKLLQSLLKSVVMFSILLGLLFESFKVGGSVFFSFRHEGIPFKLLEFRQLVGPLSQATR